MGLDASTQAESPEGRLAALHRVRATGALTVRDGGTMRTFFLRGGRLVQTASHRGEEDDAAAAGWAAGVSGATPLQVQAGMRLGGALSAEGARMTWEEGRSPANPQALDLPRALLDGIDWGLDDGTVRRRLFALAYPGAPRAVGDAAPSEDIVPPDLWEWIRSLDGHRSLAEALEFGPTNEALGARTLYLTALLGFVEFVDLSSREVRTTRVAGAGTTGDPTRSIADTIPRARAPMGPAEAAIRSEIHRIEQASNHFEVLDVPWDRTADDFQRAYFAIARILHPDRVPVTDPDLVVHASTAFDRAREAWECFRDDASRKAYVDRVVHGKKSEDELAMERVQEILAMEALFRKGMVFFHAGQVVKAHECFEEAAGKVPEQAEFRIYLGYTTWRLMRGKDPAGAARGRRMLEEALEVYGPEEGWVLLGRVCREEEDEAGARQAWRRALKANPQSREALRHLERTTSTPGSGGLKGFLSGLVGRARK